MLGADLIATGHYVRRQDLDGQSHLLKGLDPNKDQSYFLHAVGGAEIGRTLFPVGELEKPEVRRIAEENGLVTAKKKDSTGICFIGERRFKDSFLRRLPLEKPKNMGNIWKGLQTESGQMNPTVFRAFWFRVTTTRQRRSRLHHCRVATACRV